MNKEWNSMCEKFGVNPEYIDEDYSCGYPYDKTYDYPSPSADKREQLRDFVIWRENDHSLRVWVTNDKIDNIWNICGNFWLNSKEEYDTFEGEGRTYSEALASLINKIDWTESERLQILKILET